METWAILGAVLVLLGAGLGPLAGETEPNEATTSEAETHHVHIEDFEMDPDPLDVEVGDTVVWHNHDDAAHTATDDDGDWDTGTLSTDETASITFDEVAEYS
jgi:plastocyanin